MSRNNRKQKKFLKSIARQRIDQLFSLAEQEALSHHFDLANRYVFLARKIGMKHVISLSSAHKRRFCKHCYRFLLPGVTSHVRIQRGRIITYCNHCHSYSRIPLKKSTQSKRN